MKLHYRPPRTEAGAVRSSVVLDAAIEGVDEVWISSPVPQLALADPFALLLAPLALVRGEALHIEGPVSGSLLRHLDEAMRALVRTGGLPDPAGHGTVAVSAAEVVEERPGAIDLAVCAATGGVDSTFTVLRHTRLLEPPARLAIDRLVFAHGFDVPLADEDGFRRAVANVKAIGALAGVDVITAATNYRHLLPDWEMVHGAAVSAVLHATRGAAGVGLVASSAPYHDPVIPWGSAPYLDHLYSSASFEIAHDGAAADRVEKIEALAGWPEVVPHLKFCWAGSDPAVNCGRCPKCILTGIFFDLLGSPLPRFVQRPDDDLRAEVIGGMAMGPFNTLQLRWALERADALGRTDPWVAAGRSRFVSGSGETPRRRLVARLRRSGPR